MDKKSSSGLAAKLLDQLVHGKVPNGTVCTCGVDYLVSRYSTNALQVTDKIVIEAVEFIRANARQGINVSDVIRHLNVSRRTIELRFKNILNRSSKIKFIVSACSMFAKCIVKHHLQ